MIRSRGAIGALLTCLVVAACGPGPAGSSTPIDLAAASTSPAASTSRSTAAPAGAASKTTTPFPSATPASPTVAAIADLRSRISANPNDAGALRDLGLALLQRVRETADASLYAQADEALGRAHELDPGDPLVDVGIGGLQLGRHDFADALATGRTVLRSLPDLPAARAIEVDALVELGRYKEADKAVARLLQLRPDIVSLPRVSYLRELHGDLKGAIEAMRSATESPGLAPENIAYVTSLLGTLLVRSGDLAGADTAYRHALELVPVYAPAIGGLGRLAVGRGDLGEALTDFGHASDILPLPEYVIALGETQELAGDIAGSAASYALARAEIRLFGSAGVSVDLELALFEADHGDPQRALELADAACARTPTVRAADARAWALHRLGRDREGRMSADEALRLGSRDPLLRFHSGAIAAALGDAATARRDLTMALDADAGFSPTGAEEARQILAGLPG
jgi:tetratricopeptide (TPR) repeat protein